MNNYEKLAAINVNDHIEKKNGLSYLSWAWAWDQLMRVDPKASVEYHDPIRFGETMMVSCTVTAFDIPRRMHLPVMDYKNRAIPNPDSFSVNTAMQRCMVKAIAMHGLGLYIYAGEDLPQGDGPSAPITPTTGVWDSLDDTEQHFLMEIATEVKALIKSGDVVAAVDLIEGKKPDADEKVALWSRFDSKERSAMKKAAKPTEEDFQHTVRSRNARSD